VVDSFFLARTFVTLLVITDPVGTVPVFISMTTTASGRERNRAAWQAVLVAGLVIATFALFGQQILLYLDISLPSLQAAGGLLLLVVALDLLRGDVGALAGGSTTNIAFVPLGTPLLAGPGAIAAVMVFARQADRPDERLVRLAACHSNARSPVGGCGAAMRRTYPTGSATPPGHPTTAGRWSPAGRHEHETGASPARSKFVADAAKQRPAGLRVLLRLDPER
jgi:MarC family membrane protein